MRSMILAALAAIAIPAIAYAQTPETLETPVIDTKGAPIGRLVLRGSSVGIVIRLQLQAGALAPGWHGVHLHAVGDCSDTEKFMNSKAHLNHWNRKHGLLNDEGPDNGDLPNVFAAADGSVNAELFTPFARLSSGGANALRKPEGSAFIIHAAEDDHATQPIGNAGARVGCAVIK
ncbi:MAG: superoxide dismutase family protein [Alsobacter sp.]